MSRAPNGAIIRSVELKVMTLDAS